jgi:hypothetical protein
MTEAQSVPLQGLMVAGTGFNRTLARLEKPPRRHPPGNPERHVRMKTSVCETIRLLVAVTVLLSLPWASAQAQPVIKLQPSPSSTNVSLGATVQFRASATSTNSAVTYRWWFQEAPIDPAANPSAAKSLLSLTNVTLANDGPYFVVASDTVGSVTSHVATLTVDPTFTTITTGALVTDKGHQHGQAWGDYDHDGYLDVVIFDVGQQQFRLYRNNHDGTFTRLLLPGLQSLPYAYCYTFAWVDYDNDGHLDVFGASSASGTKNLLIHNNGDGTFTRITNGPIATEGGVSWQGVWADFNRDGCLDLFVANGAAVGSPSRNWFYQNQGDGSFLKLTNALTSDLGLFGSSSCVDVDEDGWQDLLVELNGGIPRLYLNTRDGGFLRVTLVSEANIWFAQAWADYDNNGTPDLFRTTMGTQFIGPVALYRNEGAGHLTKMTTNDVGPLVSERGNMGSAAWGDYDNDGWLDLFVASGRDETERGKCWLYRNNGDGTFTKITTGSLVNEIVGADAGNWVDIDHDGFLDLLVTENDHTGVTPNHLYRNNGNSNNWLCVQCVGTASPRWGTGAKVRATATIRGKSMSQLRRIDPGSSGGNQSFFAHFGLGEATNVDVLRIEWTSGIAQELHNVPVKQYLTVTEPARMHMAKPGELRIQCWKGQAFEVQVSPDLGGWTPTATITNTTGSLTFTDPDARLHEQRFYRAGSVP